MLPFLMFPKSKSCKPMTATQRRRSKWILIVFGGILELVASVILVRTGMWYESAVSAQGIVVDHQAHRGKKGGTTYSEVVTFTTATNAVITFNDSTSSNDPYPKGTPVPVLYDPTDPSSAGIDEWYRIWLLPLVVFVVGFVLFGVGWLMKIPDEPAETGDTDATVAAAES